MKRLRLLAAASVLCLVAFSVSAQSVDWKSIGKPLDDDTKPMVDRYVYINEPTTDKNVGIDKPVLSPKDIDDWVAQRLPELFAFKPTDYDQKTKTNAHFFTPKGYADYINSLNAAQLPLVVKEKRYMVSAVVTDPVNITAKGQRDDADKTQVNAPPKIVYVWQLDVPVTLGYRSFNLADTKNYKILLKLELVRIPMQEDGALIAINSWRLEEYKPTILPETPKPPRDPYAR